MPISKNHLFRGLGIGGRLTLEAFDFENYIGFEDDFVGAALNTTDGKWGTTIVKTAGTPLAQLRANEPDGVVELVLDTTAEQQVAELNWGDQRNIALAKGPVFYTRLQFVGMGASRTAVWGMGTDRVTNPDNVTASVWFKTDASAALLIESDDNTTDNDDIATGITITEGANVWYKIDCSDISAVRFSIKRASDKQWLNVGTALSMAAGTARILQPIIQLQKTGGASNPYMRVDYVGVVWERQ